MPFAATVDLDDIAAGTGGFKFQGLASNLTGWSVAGAGDVNGDGIDDVIVGASWNGSGGQFAGAAYVIFGKTDGFASTIDAGTIAGGTGGFKIQGESAFHGAGRSVSGAGDVNGDGIDDLVVGAPYNGNGAAYVVFGKTGGFATPVDLDTVAAGTGGFKIVGQQSYDRAGFSVSAGGDINGDGIDDLIVGASEAGSTEGHYLEGAAYVVFGQTGGFAAVIDLDTIAAGTGGFKIQGENAYDYTGHSVSTAGDVNGDGIDDLIVGSFYNDGGGTDAGAAYVVFGTTGGFATPIDLDTIAAGTGGFKIQGESEGDKAGVSVSDAGDVNGDGIADLIVGAYYNSSGGTEAGAAYVVFGKTGGFATPVDLDTIAAGTGGFKIQSEGEGDWAGYSVSRAGDVNGDSIDDLIVGAILDSGGGEDAGAAYIVFGRTSGFTTPVDLGVIAAGTGGFKIQGEDEGDSAGISVSAAGDVNGDGIDDLIVGAVFNYGAGAAYVIFGQLSPVGPPALFTEGDDIVDLGAFDLTQFPGTAATQALGGSDRVTLSSTQNLGVLFEGNAGADTITGSNAADRIEGDEDTDTLFGGNGNDSLWGGDGNDTALGGNGADTLSGNAGDDTLDGNAGNDRAEGGNGNDRMLGGLGNDTLLGGNGNDSALGGNGTDTLSGGGHNDNLAGGNDDDSVLGGDGADVLDGDQGTTGNGNDSLFGGNGIDSVSGGGGNDRLTGDAGNDFLFGGNGADLLDGDQGSTGNGNDSLFGGNGVDSLLGGGGNDRLSGDGGNDFLFGGNGNDQILGGAGNDSMLGGAGNDTLDGGAGIDRISGGAGTDRFAFGLIAGEYPDGSSNAQPNLINDFLNGTDKFLIDKSATGANDFAGDIVRTQVGADVRLTIQNDANATRAVVLLVTEAVGNIDASDFIFVA